MPNVLNLSQLLSADAPATSAHAGRQRLSTGFAALLDAHAAALTDADALALLSPETLAQLADGAVLTEDGETVTDPAVAAEDDADAAVPAALLAAAPVAVETRGQLQGGAARSALDPALGGATSAMVRQFAALTQDSRALAQRTLTDAAAANVAAATTATRTARQTSDTLAQGQISRGATAPTALAAERAAQAANPASAVAGANPIMVRTASEGVSVAGGVEALDQQLRAQRGAGAALAQDSAAAIARPQAGVNAANTNARQVTAGAATAAPLAAAFTDTFTTVPADDAVEPLVQSSNSTTTALSTASAALLAPSASDAAGARPAVTQASLPVPFHSPAWAAGLNQQVVALLPQQHPGLRSAELRIDPPELGPIRITLHLQGDLLQASFSAALPQVRHAIEQALPQLQQSLADAGVQLGQTSVGEQHEPAFFQAQENNGNNGTDGNATDTADASQSLSSEPVRRVPQGLVDTFA